MKPISILMALLVSGTLSAQRRVEEVNARVILFGEAIQTSGLQAGVGVKDQANVQTGPGLRLMGQVAGDSPWYWEVGGRFQSSAAMVTNRVIDLGDGKPFATDLTKVKVYYSYWSVGAAYLIPLGPSADFGIHLEGRGETINPKGDYSTSIGGTASIDAHTVYFRPWLRLSLDLKVKTGSFYTLFGGEAGAAGLRTKQQAIMPMSRIDPVTLKSMAPTWSGAVYAGFQF